MIIELKSTVSADKAKELGKRVNGIVVQDNAGICLVTSSKVKEITTDFNEYIEQTHVMDTDIQLASRSYKTETRTIDLGNGKTIGGTTGNTVMIAGPCSVEDVDQISQTAELLNSLNIGVMRGGCYKPRTSPYSFQGLGIEGLKMLADARTKNGFSIITEVRDATHVADVIEYTDIIQIGAKAMYDHGILRACGAARKPVMIKRGFGTTLQEFVQAAEFVLSGGNSDVILCERGIRTFETKTRFTLDLCGVAFLKQYTNLPIILDPSHAMGYRYGIADLTRACTAMGIDGLIIEVHPVPEVAKSDAAQQLNHEEFRALYKSLEPVAKSVGRTII